jgi:integrase
VATIRLHLEAALGNRRLARRPVADVNGLWAAKRKAGYKPNSVRILRAVLRRALAQAEREQLVPRNVAALSQPAKLGQPDGRALTVDQARKLLDTARGDRLEAAFLVLLSYGLRRGELLRLMWADRLGSPDAACAPGGAPPEERKGGRRDLPRWRIRPN